MKGLFLVATFAAAMLSAVPAEAQYRRNHPPQRDRQVIIIPVPVPTTRQPFYQTPRFYSQPNYWYGQQSYRPVESCSSRRHPELICHRQNGSRTWYYANQCGYCDDG